ncbi:hypothetical protein HBH61_068890 [Parastagonospora nodorum]|nr:hypothetical protein HBH61_068890 [Parastagonospora nodorum]
MSHLLNQSASRIKSNRCVNSRIDVQTASALRVVPEAGIDRSLVKRWLSECIEHHSVCGAGKHDGYAALLFIDVRRKCLVLTTNAGYFALSYVWGKTEQFLLKQENIVELSEDGALHKHWDKLANVLKDAITFVDNLSEQYLWVDTLCIIQDSPGRHTFLSRMNEVYRAATCTLVAMDSTNAISYLPGFVVRKRSDLASASNTSVYESRAWTFQQRTLSSRCLYFMKEQVYFQCQESIWSKDRFEDIEQDFDLEGAYPSLQWMGHFAMALECSKFSAYAQLVTQYSKRELSYPTDRLNAFSGIISSLDKAWKWKLFAGMPSNSLDQALLWGPTAACYRVQSTKMEQYLPSWPWAGCTGKVQFSEFASTHKAQIWRFIITTVNGAVDIQLPDGDKPYAIVETTKRIIPKNVADDTHLTSVSYQLKDMPNLLMFHTEVIWREDLKKEDVVQLDDAYHIYGRYRYILVAQSYPNSLRGQCAWIMLIRATEEGFSEKVVLRTVTMQEVVGRSSCLRKDLSRIVDISSSTIL